MATDTRMTTDTMKAEINALLEDIARRSNRFRNNPMLSNDDIGILIREVVGAWNVDQSTERP